ncbi:hypothetical protein D3C86_1585850 [compost metagenome]
MFESSVEKNGQLLTMRRSVATVALRDFSSGASSTSALTALPKPNQPGSSSRHWPQEKPQGIARRSSILRFFLSISLREAGREPRFRSAISVIGVVAKK